MGHKHKHRRMSDEEKLARLSMKYDKEIETGHCGGEDDLEGWLNGQTYNDWWNKYIRGNGGQTYVPCTHKPQLIIGSPKMNWSLSIGERSEVEEHLGEFDVAINCTGTTLIHPSEHVLPKELEQYVESKTDHLEEILLDWTDGSSVNLAPQFWKALADYLDRKHAKAVLFCMGGHGRTGTAAASMLIAACKMQGDEAVKWLRKAYCQKVVETKVQEEYVSRVSDFYRNPKLPI